MNIEELIGIVLNSAKTVKRALGNGFSEKVYQNSLAHELRLRGVSCECEKVFDVRYRGSLVGSFRADIVVDNQLIIELKLAEEITKAHECQLVNYLKASGIESGLVMNFGRTPLEIKRKFRNGF